MSLESRVKDIHEWVVQTLEEHPRRRHIGRFEVQNAQGEFTVGNRQEGERFKFFGEPKQYELHLELDHEEVPGTDLQYPDYVKLVFIRRILDPHRDPPPILMTYGLHPGGEEFVGQIDADGYRSLKQKIQGAQHPEAEKSN